MKSDIIKNRNQIQSNFKQILQTDEQNCGPWIIYCTTKWLDTKEINIQYLSSINIEQERTSQKSYLYMIYILQTLLKINSFPHSI